MSHSLNADLHCHSLVSDGTLAPAVLARRALDNGVQLWALTDHDELGGLAEARQACAEIGLEFVTGVEVSVSVDDQTVHVVGLGVDPAHAELRARLRGMSEGRDARARRMAEALREHTGVEDAYAGACRLAGNPALISRTHFARHLVERGVCANTGEVFARFLTPGKPGYVEHAWATLEQAIGWIREAGGLAVLAHPGRYRFTPQRERELLARFVELGGAGIEVVTGSHSAADWRKYAALAREFGLRASRGSDFHCPRESRCDLGRLPRLPEGLSPIWDLLH